MFYWLSGNPVRFIKENISLWNGPDDPWHPLVRETQTVSFSPSHNFLFFAWRVISATWSLCLSLRSGHHGYYMRTWSSFTKFFLQVRDSNKLLTTTSNWRFYWWKFTQTSTDYSTWLPVKIQISFKNLMVYFLYFFVVAVIFMWLLSRYTHCCFPNQGMGLSNHENELLLLLLLENPVPFFSTLFD